MPQKSNTEVYNIVEVCEAHAPRPRAHLTARPAESFLGCWVKRVFLSSEGGREHMWVKIDTITPEGHLEGALDNIPTQDCGVRCGDRATVALDAIEAVLEATP